MAQDDVGSDVAPAQGAGAASPASADAATAEQSTAGAAQATMNTPVIPLGSPRSRSRRGKSLVREIIETLILTAVLFLVARATVQPFRVDGCSMYPTLHDSEFILVDKVSYRFGQPQRGDVVVFKYPGDKTRDFIKRVIGQPGDLVSVKNTTIYVNHKALPESYIPAERRAAYDYHEYRVPKNVLFVLGDNRNNSFDSHSWGEQTPLYRDLVVGKALVAYWPLSQLQWFGHPAYADTSQPCI